jgi:Uma2 family endonuclease
VGREEPESREIPRLESGDRLSRDEFERRFAAMPELKKAELIEGVVYVPSPTRFRQHGKPHHQVHHWLGHYAVSTPGVECGDNSTLRLDLLNEPQPDAFLRIEPERGGQSRTSAEDYIEGAPELIVEVSASTASYDLHPKLSAYRRNRVLEYIVWRVVDRAIDWFRLSDDEYQRLAQDPSGILRSQEFPGLWLDAAALLRGDMKRVISVLDEGLRTPEHADLLRRLQASAREGK